MKKVTFINNNGQNITISALINFPQGFEEGKKYHAVVVAHPGGGVKEQTAGLYARKLAEAGFVTIAFDASYQGESTGEPRQLENPYIITEDISAVIDYLTTLPYVDSGRIGAMGICAGGGYAANAAINDRRIKAVGTVSAVNIGSMFRNGWDNNIKSADAIPVLENGSKARTAEAGGADTVTIPLAPLRKEDAPNKELEEAWEYYHTPRCEHPNAPGFATARSLNQIITYDAFNMAGGVPDPAAADRRGQRGGQQVDERRPLRAGSEQGQALPRRRGREPHVAVRRREVRRARRPGQSTAASAHRNRFRRVSVGS